MSILQDYNLRWSDQLIQRVELHMRDVHSAITQLYESEGYPTRVALPERKTEAAAVAGAQDGTVDVVSPAGSFLLRVSTHSAPLRALHRERGVGCDVVLTMPESHCGQIDVQDGRYLDLRATFLAKVEAYLKKLSSGAAARVAAAKHGAEDEDEDDEGEKDGEASTAAGNSSAAARLSRMEVRRRPIHGCHSCAEKEILQLRFRQPRPAAAAESDEVRYELVDVYVHLRPAVCSTRATCAASTKKHPLYSYLVLEDYLMPVYLQTLHTTCVNSASFRRAIVMLKCWAHHAGLMANASGHPEGLNGFLLAAMVHQLAQEGIISASMSDDHIVRAVWVHLTRGSYTPAKGQARASSGGEDGALSAIPTAEANGEVAVLRLGGEVLNLLFRTSAAYFKAVVVPAAEEALQHPQPLAYLQSVPFLPLQLRFDVALTINLHQSGTSSASTIDRSPALLKCKALIPPRLQMVQQLHTVLTEALRGRANFLSLWMSSAETVEVLVQLTTSAEGRNRLTRGPSIEDSAAVAAFDAFWGADRTSTRQFADGATYRCVLWSFAEDAYANTTNSLAASTVVRQVAAYAIRKHAAPDATVSVLLGGLEGVLAEKIGAEWMDSAPMMQKSLLDASSAVQRIITNLPRSAIPCTITSFDIISASERYTEVFPVRPHLALTYTTDDLSAEAYNALSVAPTIEPIHCVLSIDDKHKIPDSLDAIAAMKGAICAQLAKAVDQLYGDAALAKSAAKKSAGSSGSDAAAPSPRVRTLCTSHSVDLILRGYLFRIYVAHYREVSLLRALQREAEANVLEQKLFWTAQHAKLLRSLSFGHPSYGNATRLAKRWVSAMLLAEFILPEAIELLVAHAYLQSSGVPKTPAGGFLRFIQLLATHDWSTALILPFVEKDAAAALNLRALGEQQGMYLAAPYAQAESPFTAQTPRPIIVHRLVQLAKAVLVLLLRHLELRGGGVAATEADVFRSDPHAFDVRLAMHPQLLLQPDRAIHPTEAAKVEVLHHLFQLDDLEEKASRDYLTQLIEREPAAQAVRTVRGALRDQGMVFYDAIAPSAIHVIALTDTIMPQKTQALQREVLRVGRGAFVAPEPSDYTPAPEKPAHAAGEGVAERRPRPSQRGGGKQQQQQHKHHQHQCHDGCQHGSPRGAQRPSKETKRPREAEAAAAAPSKQQKRTPSAKTSRPRR